MDRRHSDVVRLRRSESSDDDRGQRQLARGSPTVLADHGTGVKEEEELTALPRSPAGFKNTFTVKGKAEEKVRGKGNIWNREGRERRKEGAKTALKLISSYGLGTFTIAFYNNGS